MKAKKTIVCRILNPTKKKLRLLEKEYRNAQDFCSTERYSLVGKRKIRVFIGTHLLGRNLAWIYIGGQ